MIQTQTWYELATAERIAAEMSLGESDGWTYRVVPSPDGTRARVEAYDEHGEYVADVTGY